LYATRTVFTRPFVRDIEIPALLSALGKKRSFRAIPVLRGIGYPELKTLSAGHFGRSLAGFHGSQDLKDLPLRSPSTDDLRRSCAEVARGALRSRLALVPLSDSGAALSLRIKTRNTDAPGKQERLYVDAANQLDGDGAFSPEAWKGVRAGLVDVRDAITERFGDRRLSVCGRFHLSLAFLLAGLFPQPRGVALDIEQHTGASSAVWSTDAVPSRAPRVVIEVRDLAGTDGPLVVGLSISQLVGDAAEKLLKTLGRKAVRYLHVMPKGGPSRECVSDAAACCGLARAIAREILQQRSQKPFTGLHVLACVPQSLAIMIGRHLNTLGPIQLYEYDPEACRYRPSVEFTVPLAGR
jgi:hypothetical protein